jgi:hypothetical protein
MRVLSWWSLPVWASGRQITLGPLRNRPRGGGGAPAFRLVFAPSEAGMQPVGSIPVRHAHYLLPPEAVRHAPSLACPAL